MTTAEQFRVRPPVICSPLLAACALAAALALGEIAGATKGETCTAFPPIRMVAGEGWYSDKAGSVIDRDALLRHQAKIKPLRDYVTYLVAALDRGAFECVRTNLRTWAQADALLVQPSTFEGMRERLRFMTAIDFVAIRMKSAHQQLDEPIQPWLGKVNERIAEDYGNRRLYDNERIWTGVAAITAALVTGDARLQAYADDVWLHALEAITDSGAISTEVRRQARSLLYHAYYLSAVLFLRTAREAFGIVVTGEEDRAIRRLYSLVRSGTCQPATFAVATKLPAPQVLPQVHPNDADIATINTFGTEFVGSTPLCNQKQPGSFQPLLGGELGAMKSVFESARH